MARKKRILVIDDEARFTRLLKVALENSGGYEVAQANSAAEGLAAARTAPPPDLILLDVIMPDQSGTEVASQLGADEQLKKTPIVFLTAAVPKDAADSRRGTLNGRPFIAKPVSLDDLIACIEQHVTTVGEQPSGSGDAPSTQTQ